MNKRDEQSLIRAAEIIDTMNQQFYESSSEWLSSLTADLKGLALSGRTIERLAAKKQKRQAEAPQVVAYVPPSPPPVAVDWSQIVAVEAG